MKKILPFLILAYAVFAANEYTPTYGPVGTNEFTPAYDSGDEEAGVTQFTVSYNANGGTGSAASQTLDSNSSVTLSTGGTIARAEYVLDKWNTAANGSGTDYALGGTLDPLIADVTLYAQWVWDTLEVYGIRQDTAEVGDTIAIGWHCPNYESATVTTGETPWTVLGTTDADSLRLVVPSVPLDSFYTFSICDEVSCDTTTDSIFIKSHDITQFTIDTTITGGSGSRITFSHYGLVDSGTTVTVSITVPADSIWYVSGDTSGLLMGGYTFDLSADYAVTFTRMLRNPITFTTTASSFTPRISCTGTYSLMWVWSDGTTSTDTMPTKSFGSAGNRNQQLIAYPWTAIKKINLGYDGSDGGGTFNPTSDYHSRQYVSHVSGLSSVSDSLEKFYCLQSSIDSLDFHGFDRLDAIEDYFGTAVYLNISDCPLLRRICFEACNLAALDVSTCPRMADIRAAFNEFESVTFATVQDSLWHLCLQSGALNTLPPVGTTFPVLQELWVWNCQLSSDPQIGVGNTELYSIRLDGNNYTGPALDAVVDSLVKTNRTNAQGWLYMTGNSGFVSDRIRDSIAVMEADGWHVYYDTLPEYTRDTIISGGHATVAVVPATLSPVDSATACTTSVSAVDEGWRCDSIVSVRGGQRYTVTYPTSRITYQIAANTVDSIFTSEIPVIPDSSSISFTQPDNGTISIDPVALRRAAGDETQIVFTPDAHYHFGGWTGGLADSTNDTVNYVFPAIGTMTFSGTAWIDTHYLAYTITGGNAAVTFFGDSIAAYGETIRAYLSVNAGYRATWPGGVLVSGNDTLDVLMTKDSTLSVAVFGIPVVDSIRPGPKANRNDSCTARGVRFTNGGVVRNITAGANAVQKSWTATQIDFYTALTWPRGWNMLVFTNSDSLRDTAGLYITIPRKTN